MINPSTMPYERYAAALAEELSRVGLNATPAQPGSESEWQRWAITIVSIPGLSKYAVPSPAGYKGWRDWASAFTRAFTAT